MSRIERMPATSEPSSTITCRNPPRSLERPVRRRVDDVGGQVHPDELIVDALSNAVGVKDVALGDDARTAPFVLHHDGRAHASGGHPPRGFAQRVLRSDGDDDRVHSVPYQHDRPPFSFSTAWRRSLFTRRLRRLLGDVAEMGAHLGVWPERSPVAPGQSRVVAGSYSSSSTTASATESARRLKITTRASQR